MYFVFGVISLVLCIISLVFMIIHAINNLGDYWIICFVGTLLMTIAFMWRANSIAKMGEGEYNAFKETDKFIPKEVTYREGDTLICPCCGSHEVQFFEPKFNKKKALIGTVVTGSLLGAYFGVPKDGVYKAVCNHCGHHWKAKIK